MQKISYAGCLGLSLAISSQFAVGMCAAVKNFGGSRSYKVIDVNKSKNPVTGACYDKQHVCTYLQPFSQ